jgi:L,D-transpeptidase catalytic domain
VFFHESIALHAAFWHDRFGDKRSHGCVNLSPRDARTVFDLLAPALPDGWYAIVSTGKQPGSRVIVR